MTTIAWDGKILASDTLSTSGNMKLSGTTIKIKRVGRYRVAFAGDSASANVFFDTYLKLTLEVDSYQFEPHNPSQIDDFSILVIEDNKDYCLIYNSSTGYWDSFNYPISIGSGCKYAMGSMYTGADAVKAVEVACQLDVHSGLPVITEH